MLYSDSRRLQASATRVIASAGAELMETPKSVLDSLKRVNESAAFNRFCGIEVLMADAGRAEIAMLWRSELGQYSGYLHAGVIAALIDTACGYAAATVAGQVLASHFAVNCLRPAVGERFVARARVVKPGKSQVFTSCELLALSGGQETLVATGEALLVPVASSSPG